MSSDVKATDQKPADEKEKSAAVAATPAPEVKQPEPAAAAKPATAKKPAAPKKTPAAKADVKKTVAPAKGTPNFKSESVEALVAQYNEMVLTATDLGVKKVTTVRSFVDAKTGVLACERLHAVITKTRDEAKESNVERTSKKSKASARKSVKGKTSAKRMTFEDTAKINWIAAENPFRPGTGRFKRVEKLRTCSGKTVKLFHEKGGKDGTLAHCVRAKLVKVA